MAETHRVSELVRHYVLRVGTGRLKHREAHSVVKASSAAGAGELTCNGAHIVTPPAFHDPNRFGLALHREDIVGGGQQGLVYLQVEVADGQKRTRHPEQFILRRQAFDDVKD